MKKSRFTEEQIAYALKQAELGTAVGEICRKMGVSEATKVDNGSEFAGKVMDRWAYENGVELYFSRRGAPTDNAVVESFNGRLRQEYLNEHWFLSLAHSRSKISEWQTFYNEDRLHAALAWKTPVEFACECGDQVDSQAPKAVGISTG